MQQNFLDFWSEKFYTFCATEATSYRWALKSVYFFIGKALHLYIEKSLCKSFKSALSRQRQFLATENSEQKY